MRGFTIIEVMMFLAISSALAIFLIVGTGMTIQQQRYQDSVNTFTSQLQAEFTAVAQVENERSPTWSCTGGSIQLLQNGGASRGTTACTIVGRYVTVSPDGKTMLGYPVIATQAAPETATSDSDAFAAMRLVVYRPDDTTGALRVSRQTLEWDAYLTTPTDGRASAPFSLFVYRSPITGSVSSFSTASGNADVSSFLGDSATIQICVRLDTVVQRRTAIEIVERAASSNAVRVIGEGICR